jgi:hypothetical protein
LTVHSRASKKTSQPLVAFVNFPEGPRDVEIIVPQIDRGLIGKTFKAEAKQFFEWFDYIKESQEGYKC